MTDFSGATIQKLIIHSVGNKLKEEELLFSKVCANISENSLHNILGRYFFQRFKENPLYKFHHKTDLIFNEIYQYTKAIFLDINSFEDNSKNIANHLYEVSTHPNIKPGELSIAFIEGINLKGTLCNAVGIFKSENKEPFLKIHSDGQSFTVDWDQGIDTNKLDKGCIIFNNQMETGYSVLPVDSGSGIDTKYWKEDFLGIQIEDNSSNKTKLIVEACKEYVKKDLVIDKKDKVMMLNNVIDYMVEKPDIDLNDFTMNVAKNLDQSEELKDFINVYAEKKNFSNVENFSIDHSALKNIKRNIKNFIKLDTNYEIKINKASVNNSHYLEKGYDEQKHMHFYKIYFNEEE
ncbi:nucleoid-associated protein [Paenibacillus sp. KN14-4R]|uniref:nucleoid-associated protein n=1 Tax=Paenibacillus sp. KN14-4R TaxID=3445773 RepID=UPI003FA0D11D